MYVVTFYSFKGGVGRSMALVNVALDLANRGRSVLLVDFDLEAPGLGTFGLQRQRNGTRPGVVEYVSEYLRTSEAPAVGDYCGRCPGIGRDGGELWLMPAGDQSVLYGGRLNAIDWQCLYEQRDGYLLFEDLKAQWNEFLDPDYVLIDSRTGHTDVGGICTRQLPNAVVVLFFPNDQNLQGLEKVVADIRSERVGERKRDIQLHFVTSNVPDLDDEDQILEERLASFKENLGYEEVTATIHHYNSLALLNQVIFTRDRPKSRLAREYRSLANEIVNANSEDREGALQYLAKHHRQAWMPRRHPPAAEDLDQRLSEINKQHATDGEVLYNLALVRERLGLREDYAELLTRAIDAGYSKPDVYIRRARLRSGSDGSADARLALTSGDANRIETDAAIRFLAEHDPAQLNTPEVLRAFTALPHRRRTHVARTTMTSLEGAAAAQTILRGIVEDPDVTARNQENARIELTLALIAEAEFEAAIELIEEHSEPSKFEISDAFNYAMARWGSSGTPNREDFERVLSLHEAEDTRKLGANYFQCVSLACAVLADFDRANEYLRRARDLVQPANEFSCWRYLQATMAEFMADLSEMSSHYERALLDPPFVARDQ